MTTVVRTADVRTSEVPGLLRPRRCLVEELTIGPGRFVAGRGPVSGYRRAVDVHDREPGWCVVTQTVEYRLAVPLIGWLVAVPARRHLARIHDGGPPWWGPPDVLDATAWAALGALLTLATALGYLGTLLTQTITYAAQEFHVGTGAEGVALAVVRADIIVSLGLVALADRRGRRVIALGGATVGCALTVLGAATPSLAWLAASQVAARGFVTAATIASAVMVAEAMPKGARAWAVGVIAMASAVGAGVCVVALPVTGLGVGAWRLLYVGGAAWLVAVAAAGRRLVESDRYVRYRRAAAVLLPIGRSRLVLLAAANLLLMMFVTPASEFLNEYLRRERHFSPERITLFVLVTVLPGAIGIVVGGRLADTRGRRGVGVVAVIGLAVFDVFGFWTGGWPMWVAATIGTVTGAAVTPAITVYGAELFSTGRRGAANGLLTAAGRAGAVVGLLAVGGLSQWIGRFGPAFAAVAVGPVILVVLILVAFPETAKRSLEELNPGDPEVPSTAE
jgi:MFS family permease